MNRTIYTLVMTLLLSATAPALSAQASDYTGTWIGEATVPGTSDKDMVTLELRKAENSYAGTISDSLNLVRDGAIREVILGELGTLRFKFTLTRGNQEVTAKVTLDYIAGKLMGAWMIENGPYSPLDLSPQKKTS
jgi:hypothetical protein